MIRIAFDRINTIGGSLGSRLIHASDARHKRNPVVPLKANHNDLFNENGNTFRVEFSALQVIIIKKHFI